MRVFLSWMLAFGLMGLPVMAGTDGKDDATGKADAKTAAKKAADGTKPAGAGKVAPAADPAVEAEIQQLRELVEAQARQLEEQRAALQAQQGRMTALEAELQQHAPDATVAAVAGAPSGSSSSIAVGGGPTGAPTTVAAAGTPSAGAAPQAQDLGQRMSAMEEKMKHVGPVAFTGDFRLRDEPFFGGPTNESQVRNRERYRLRLYANIKVNDDINGGIAFSTGDTNDPISTNQTDNQFYTRKAFNLDRAFINYNPSYFKPLTLTGGKFAYPFYNTELVWDKDLNPEGLAQTLAFVLDTLVLKKIALVGFELPFTEVAGTSTNDKSIVQSAVYGGQFQTNWQLGSRVKFSTYTSYYNYHNADPIAFALATASLKNPTTPGVGTEPLGGPSSVQNSITTTTATAVVTVPGMPTPISTGIKTVTNAQFASKFGLFDNIARFDFDTGHEKWPVILQGDYVQNTRACSNVGNILPAPANTATQTFSQSTNAPCDPRQRRGYWLEGRVGRTNFPGQIAKKGDWDFAYTRIFLEREAVMGAFNFSDLRQATNVTEHRMEIFYQVYPNVQFAFTGLFGRPLNFGGNSTTPPTPAEPILKRLQFDVTYRF
jgi:Putative porin